MVRLADESLVRRWKRSRLRQAKRNESFAGDLNRLALLRYGTTVTARATRYVLVRMTGNSKFRLLFPGNSARSPQRMH